MTTTFKVGDRVELIEFFLGADIGATAYVSSIDSECIYIKWDRSDLRCNNQEDGGYSEKIFKLIKPQEWDNEENV